MKINTNRGSALLTVLWLTAALSAIGLAVAANVRGETDRTTTGLDDLRAYFIARGAIDRALIHMQRGIAYYHRGDPRMELAFPGAIATVEIIPETSKLSLGYTQPEELLRLMAALGIPQERGETITAAILDWRTPPPQGSSSPFDAFYLSQTPSFVPMRTSSFLETEELLLVRGVTPDICYGTALDGHGVNSGRAGLRDCVSAHASGGGLDVNTARRETLIAIGVDPGDAAAIVQRRSIRPILEQAEFEEIRKAVGPAGNRLGYGGNSMYTLRATVQLLGTDGKPTDFRRTVAALVKRFDPNNKQNRAPGFEVVRWYDRD